MHADSALAPVLLRHKPLPEWTLISLYLVELRHWWGGRGRGHLRGGGGTGGGTREGASEGGYAVPGGAAALVGRVGVSEGGADRWTAPLDHQHFLMQPLISPTPLNISFS